MGAKPFGLVLPVGIEDGELGDDVGAGASEAKAEPKPSAVAAIVPSRKKHVRRTRGRREGGFRPLVPGRARSQACTGCADGGRASNRDAGLSQPRRRFGGSRLKGMRHVPRGTTCRIGRLSPAIKEAVGEPSAQIFELVSPFRLSRRHPGSDWKRPSCAGGRGIHNALVGRDDEDVAGRPRAPPPPLGQQQRHQIAPNGRLAGSRPESVRNRALTAARAMAGVAASPRGAPKPESWNKRPGKGPRQRVRERQSASRSTATATWVEIHSMVIQMISIGEPRRPSSRQT